MGVQRLFSFGWLCILAFWLIACTKTDPVGIWDFQTSLNQKPATGQMEITYQDGLYQGAISSDDLGTIDLKKFTIQRKELLAEFDLHDELYFLSGEFDGIEFHGHLVAESKVLSFNAVKQSTEPVTIDRSHIQYLLSANDLEETELNIDHAGLIQELDDEAVKRGSRIYNSNCVNCHGTPDIEGSIPTALKFWAQPFKTGGDPYSMYLTITRGYGAMPAQLTLTPREKYDVISYIREQYVREYNQDSYYQTTTGYLAGLPQGDSKGPEPQPYHPWSDQDYGNFFINTYELVDEETGIDRYHSPGPTPYPDEDYTQNNFAYKGIAIRLDPGPGGVSDGKAWMIFDHDLMRVAGGWTGQGFIDWDGILLNDRHETYPRTSGKLHFETPVGPVWANPDNGSFDDPRFQARDGRHFGPLPKKWANYKGLYHHGNHVVISYSVGDANILEELGMVVSGEQTVFTRTFNVKPAAGLLKLRVAPLKNQVHLIGSGATLIEEEGFHTMVVSKSTQANLKLFIAAEEVSNVQEIAEDAADVPDLSAYTEGGPAHYPQRLTSLITKGTEQGMLAVDQLTPPFDNPWDCRMKLSGLDFMSDANQAVACTTDGDIWFITGLTDGSASLTWQRIGAGLFQPLGIKVLKDQIYVICRDQLVLLRDFNGDRETDFYESFNHDHQVTDHFHEFAMGLQADVRGNLYYAKSGRHAREALIPQHGTLIKVSPDGTKSEIIATGFRAANGVCLNPDGSFLVTDQQGYWNPMNRINWIEPASTPRFYGNMWGYNPPDDTTRAAMEPPMVWVDMEFDRSPSELLWVDSEKWGPLNGSLLSLSYGYGKMQLVLHEEVNGQKQGGVIDIPGISFYTGVMRGRYNPQDGNLYACGMAAWATSKNIRPGDLYRIRYTGKPLPLPVDLKAWKSGIELGFAEMLDPELAADTAHYQVKTWELVRSSRYGSDRHNQKTLRIAKAVLQPDGKSVKLYLPDIQPVDVMTISYQLKDQQGNPMQGTVQNTIHNLRPEPDA